MESDTEFWVDLVLKLVLVTIVAFMGWYFFVHIAPSLNEAAAQNRERTVQECVAAFEYSRAQCEFIIAHPRLNVR